jgi:hypothetical protein
LRLLVRRARSLKHHAAEFLDGFPFWRVAGLAQAPVAIAAAAEVEPTNPNAFRTSNSPYRDFSLEDPHCRFGDLDTHQAFGPWPSMRSSAELVNLRELG